MHTPTQSSLDLLHATETFVKQYMRRYDASHDYSHIQRVVRTAKHIATAEQASGAQLDTNLVKLAALLHDVGDAKYASPSDPADPVRRFLRSAGADEDLAAVVQEVVDRVSFSKEQKDAEGVQRVLRAHPELGVVQDADRLDAIGAVGIGRCFTFGASLAERERRKNGDVDGAVDQHDDGVIGMDQAIVHFDEKLVHLEGMMKTATGRSMARKRTERLLEFKKWWQEEQSGIL